MYTREEMLSAFEFGWCVGLFEGEGCISHFDKAKKYKSMSIEMTDPDVLQRFYNFVKVGKINGPYHSPSKPENLKPVYKWTTGKKPIVKSLLEEFTPHFGERRRSKALEVLEYYETTD